MKLFSKCANCRKRKLIVKKREYKIHGVKDPITSKNLLCRNCYKGIGQLLK